MKPSQNPLQQLSLQLNYWFKSLFFLQFLPHAFLYSLKRDRMERRYSSKSAQSGAAQSPSQPGQLLNVAQTERGVQIKFEQADLTVDFLTPDLVRVTWTPGKLPLPYAIACEEWNAVPFTVSQDGEIWAIASSAIKILLSEEGHLSFLDEKGAEIRRELPPQRQGDRWIQTAPLHSEEHIYGLGERMNGLNLRAATDKNQSPKRYRNWNFDPGNIREMGSDPLYLGIPTYLGLHDTGSYLVFYENTFSSMFTFAEEAIATFENGALRYYLALGNPAHLLGRYTQLTGRAPLPPRWALGYHQSRWGYRTEETLRSELEAFQSHQLSLSALHMDIDCQVDHRSFTFDPARFPNLKSLIKTFQESDVKLVAINNPGVQYNRNNNLFIEGYLIKAFCTYPNGELVVAPVWAGWSVFPDFTDAEVRHWWSRQFAYLLTIDIAGFWNDMNEPSIFALWGDPSLPQSTQHCLEGRQGNHREAHNIYGFLQAIASYESIQEFRPEHRPFIVSRSGWAGIQRYAWKWTGDVPSSWEALRQTIATVINLGLSGLPFTGSDIGGFWGNPSAELYVRWFQMATFMMFYRTHSSNASAPRSPWTYGEPYLSIIRRFLNLRYQLLSYFYTLAWHASQTGHPPVRPLFWGEPDNRSLWAVEEAFYLGDALLIYPVVAPSPGQPSALSHPASHYIEQEIELPKGQWYDFWTGQVITGNRTIHLKTALEQIPVFVKAGTVLPMEDAGMLTLHLYPPVDGEAESLLFSDAGEGYGRDRLDCFHLQQEGRSLTLRWKTQGDYPFPYKAVRLTVHGASVQELQIDGKNIPTCEILQDAPFHLAEFLL